MEKHWCSVVSRSVCDYFFDALAKASSPSDVPPVISTPHYYLISIFRNNMHFVAVVQNEGAFICLSVCLAALSVSRLHLSVYHPSPCVSICLPVCKPVTLSPHATELLFSFLLFEQVH